MEEEEQKIQTNPIVMEVSEDNLKDDNDDAAKDQGERESSNESVKVIDSQTDEGSVKEQDKELENRDEGKDNEAEVEVLEIQQSESAVEQRQGVSKIEEVDVEQEGEQQQHKENTVNNQKVEQSYYHHRAQPQSVIEIIDEEENEDDNLKKYIFINKRFKQLKEQEMIQQQHQKQTLAELNAVKSQNQELIEKNHKLEKEAQFRKIDQEVNQKYDDNSKKFAELLAAYQIDIKDVFSRISNNPILEKYKKQNDELLIENTNLRRQVIKLTEDLSEKHLEDIRTAIVDDSRNSKNANSREQQEQIFEIMMEKFAEMDERMVKNDDEKFEAIQQQNFWFNKAQTFEKEIESLKELLKVQSEQVQSAQTQIKQPTRKQQAIAKQQPPQSLSKKRKSTKDQSEDEEETKIEKKNKPNSDAEKMANTQGEIEDSETHLSSQTAPQQELIENRSSKDTNTSKQVDISPPAAALPILKPASSTPAPQNRQTQNLFILRLCPNCSLTIKKAQITETCTNCSKDFHQKCKGAGIQGSLCNACSQKQKKQQAIVLDNPNELVEENH